MEDDKQDSLQETKKSDDSSVRDSIDELMTMLGATRDEYPGWIDPSDCFYDEPPSFDDEMDTDD
jgi:hypothetical protein